MHRVRTISALGPLLLSAVLLVEACGSTPPPGPATSTPAAASIDAVASPSSTSQANASPDASAASAEASPAISSAPSQTADVIAPFLVNISGRGFRANAAVTGTLAVATTTSPVSGTYALSGGDYERVLKIGAGARVPSQAFRVVNDSAFSSSGGGPWFEAAFPAAGTDLGTVLRSVKTVNDMGIETKDGRQLHHLVATDVALPPAVLGLADKTIKDVTGTLDFWVTDDGMPQIVGASGAWTQANGKDPAAPATLNAEFTLSNVGGTVDLSAPDQIWRRVKSKKYHYTMAAPTDWEYQKAHGKRTDWYVGPEYATLFAAYEPNHGASLNTWVKYFIQAGPRVTGIKGFKVASNKPATLAGARARRLELKDTYKGTKEYAIIELAEHGGKVYVLTYGSSKPITTADRALFDQFLSTFQF